MKCLFIIMLSVMLLHVRAAELKVDYSGRDKEAYRNFKSALTAAKDGDTIKILKVDFPVCDAIVIKNRSNLTVDGMFNTFSGLNKVTGKEWKMVSPGLWERKIRLQTGLAMRYFMVIDGKLNRMGRFFKAKCPTRYRKPDELKENQWTIIANPGTDSKRTKLYSIFLRLDKSVKNIADANVCEPRFSQTCGVEISGKCQNLTFKNMICRNFLNDGYNIHNTCTNTVFDTVCAIDCGDDGISAHENSRIEVRNFVSIGNSTGICHIQKVTASHTNCYIEKALGKDIYFKAEKTNLLNNHLKNVFVKTSSAGGVCLGTVPQDKLTIDKMVVVLASPDATFNFTPDRKSAISTANITVRTSEPANMAAFRKSLFAKFNGEIEKNLK